MHFIKYHCLSNDFVLFEYNQFSRQNLPDTIRHIAHRKHGVGCDQVLIYDTQSLQVEIYNQDGTEVEMCGNGLCALGHLLLSDSSQNQLMLKTKTGEHMLQKLDRDYIRVSLTVPKFDWRDIPLSHASAVEAVSSSSGDLHVAAACVNVGNPHLVFFVEDLGSMDINHWGPKFEQDELFPQGINVGFAQIKDDGIHLKVWERGAGYTQACGSGACAAFAAAKHLGLLDGSESRVLQAGGMSNVTWAGEDQKVALTAQPTAVLEGTVL